MINNNFIYVNKTSISQGQCLNIIKTFELDNTKYEGVTMGGLDKNIKDTTDLNILNNDEKWYKYTSFLSKELKRNIQKYIDELNKKFSVSDNIDNKYIFFNNNEFKINTMLMQRYTQNKGKYIYHHDFMVDPVKKQNRVITFLWYINTVEEGGETCFGESLKIKPEQGKLILFPACWTFPHCGKTPLSSDKYIITGWIYVDY
jgi:hypothetical protein